MVKQLNSCNNKKEIIINGGEGGSIYQNYIPFTADKVIKQLRIFIFNGLATPPQVYMKLQSTK